MSLAKEALEFALKLTEKSDNAILPHFRNCTIQYKDNGSELTIADQKAEEVIRTEIEKTFPDHEILGEEFGEKTVTDAEFKWVIDPIDGTTQFSLGLFTFGTLIALLQNDQPVMGIIHMPAMSETTYAAKNFGCWFKVKGEQAQRIYTRQENKNIEQAFISSAGVHATEFQTEGNGQHIKIGHVLNHAKKFRYLGDCKQHALVAMGKVDAAIDTIMQPWDNAAIIPCIREAGGVVSTTSGNEENVVFGGSLLSVANRELHTQLVSEFGKSF